MADYVLIARLVLGLYLFITGLLKLPDLKGFVRLVRTYGGMALKYPFMGYLMPFSELVLGVALLAPFYLPWAAAASLLMCIIYTYGVSTALIRRQKMENCGCFGTTIKVPLTKWSLVEDLVCVALSIIILVGSYGI